MAAVLLGVVELWLSQGHPNTARTGVWASAALICVPQPSGECRRAGSGTRVLARFILEFCGVVDQAAGELSRRRPVSPRPGFLRFGQ
jgi:hypothetical protein